MRSILVGVLLGLGALLTLSANATVWVNRTIFNTDEFVGTVREVLDDEEVQQELSVRLADRVVASGNLEARIQESLPDGLTFLAPILTVTAHDLIERVTLRILQSDEIAAVFDTALRAVHTQVVRIAEGEGNLLFEEGQVVLDLRGVLQSVLDQLGVDRPDGLLSGIELPPDAGQIVLVEDAPRAEAIQRLLSLHSQITWGVIAAALLSLALAVLIARDRRAAVRNVGLVMLLCGMLAIVLLVPIRPIVASFAQNGGAAKVIFDAFVDRFTAQSFALVVIGLLIVGGAALAGEGGLARAIRARARREQGAPAPDLAKEIRASATSLRVGGLVVGALLLVAWPDPTDRVYITVLIVLAAYFVGLWAVTSESGWATSARERISRLTPQGDGRARPESWLGRNSMYLRVAGVAVAIIAMILVPNLGIGSFVGIVALTLVYLAVIDWLATRQEET